MRGVTGPGGLVPAGTPGPKSSALVAPPPLARRKSLCFVLSLGVRGTKASQHLLHSSMRTERGYGALSGTNLVPGMPFAVKGVLRWFGK